MKFEFYLIVWSSLFFVSFGQRFFNPPRALFRPFRPLFNAMLRPRDSPSREQTPFIPPPPPRRPLFRQQGPPPRIRPPPSAGLFRPTRENRPHLPPSLQPAPPPVFRLPSQPLQNPSVGQPLQGPSIVQPLQDPSVQPQSNFLVDPELLQNDISAIPRDLSGFGPPRPDTVIPLPVQEETADSESNLDEIQPPPPPPPPPTLKAIKGPPPVVEVEPPSPEGTVQVAPPQTPMIVKASLLGSSTRVFHPTTSVNEPTLTNALSKQPTFFRNGHPPRPRVPANPPRNTESSVFFLNHGQLKPTSILQNPSNGSSESPKVMRAIRVASVIGLNSENSNSESSLPLNAGVLPLANEGPPTNPRFPPFF